MNADRYIEMLRRRFIPGHLIWIQLFFNRMVHHPTVRTAPFNTLRQYLLGDRLISRRTDNPWPPYSPDLTPLDYFLWGYLKERVYEDNPDTIERLKKNVKREIRRIPNDVLERVMDNFNVRVANVIQQRGAWIEHIINY